MLQHPESVWSYYCLPSGEREISIDGTAQPKKDRVESIQIAESSTMSGLSLVRMVSGCYTWRGVLVFLFVPF